MFEYIICGVAGFLLAILFLYKNTSSNRFVYTNATSIARDLLNAYDYGESSVKSTFEELKCKPLKNVIIKTIKYSKHLTSEQNIWLALVFYMAHKYAKYEYDKKHFHEVVKICYGSESFLYEKFCAIDYMLDHSPLLYSDDGFPRSKEISHHGFYDYADEGFYEYVYLLATSSKL